MGRTKELLFNTIVIGIGKFSTQVISFLLLPLYTSLLTTEEYGIYDLIVTITTLLLPVITLLMEESMFRFLIDAKNEQEKRKVISQTILCVLFGTIVFSIIYLVICLFAAFKYKCLIYLYIIINIVISLRNALARGLSQIKLFSIVNFISSFIVIILNVFGIVVFKLGFVTLLYSNIIAGVITSIIVFIKLKIYKFLKIDCIEKETIKDMIKYSLPLVPNSLSWTIINFSDRIILSTYLGVAANGVYSVAHKFPSIVDSIYSFFYTSWKESAAKTLNDEDSEKFYNYIYMNLKNFMLAIVIGIVAIMPFVFEFFIKKEFIEAYNYIPMLMISIYYGNISGFYGGIFSAYKDTKIMGITTIYAAIINVIVNILLIKYIGIWSAAISTLISNIFVYIYRKNKIKKYINLKENLNLSVMFVVISIVLIAYYSLNIWIKLIGLLLACIYCFYINFNLIKIILKK